jgi:hypothetical protein
MFNKVSCHGGAYATLTSTLEEPLHSPLLFTTTNEPIFVRFEVFTAVIMKNAVF